MIRRWTVWEVVEGRGKNLIAVESMYRQMMASRGYQEEPIVPGLIGRDVPKHQMADGGWQTELDAASLYLPHGLSTARMELHPKYIKHLQYL